MEPLRQRMCTFNLRDTVNIPPEASYQFTKIFIIKHEIKLEIAQMIGLQVCWMVGEYITDEVVYIFRFHRNLKSLF